MKEASDKATDKVSKIIYEVFESLNSNSFAALGRPDAAVWERPLIGVAAGDDRYFTFLKEHIGEFHWSPEEVFGLKYGESPDSSSLRVISVVFPHTEETKKLQSRERQYPSENWAVSRGDTDITPRGDRGHYDWCLYFRSGICGACIRRCPERCITENGHDKEKCAAYLGASYDALSEKLDVSSYAEVGCGLCQTEVPCMDKRP